MKLSKILAVMSATALCASMLALPASADDSSDGPKNNRFYNATGEWTYTYSGDQIKAASEHISESSKTTDDPDGSTDVQVNANEDGTYTCGFNIQVGHVKHAKVTMTVSSTENNIYNGTDDSGNVISGNSDTLWTVQTSWNMDAPADIIEGTIKYTDTTAAGATELTDWDSGGTKYNGQWAQFIMTNDNVSSLTITVKVVADSESKWEYHTYDDTKTADEQVYEVFRMFGGDSCIAETVPYETISDQIEAQFSSSTTSSEGETSSTSGETTSSSGSTDTTSSSASGSSTTGTSSSGSSTGTSGSASKASTTSTASTSSTSDNTAESGASAGLGLAIAALAGAAIVVSRKR